MRVITEAMHLLKDNPAISAIEEAGKEDPDYSMILDYIRTNRNFRELPTPLKVSKLVGSGLSLRFGQRQKS